VNASEFFNLKKINPKAMERYLACEAVVRNADGVQGASSGSALVRE